MRTLTGHELGAHSVAFITSERLSSEGWQSCSSCHFNGLTDSVVWRFGSGPRKSLPLNSTFGGTDRTAQKVLNYSGVNVTLEDFENNVRATVGARQPRRRGHLLGRRRRPRARWTPTTA